MTAACSTPGKRNRVRWLAAGLLVVGLAGTAFFWPRFGPAPLPPLTSSPFLNTRPNVAYVGDQACTGCHGDLSKAYHQHPMGRSLFRAAEAPPLEQYDPKANNPFQAGGIHYQVIRQDSRLIHREWCEDAKGNVVTEIEADIAYAIGSGSQSRSYIVQRDGFLFESPITWYRRQAQWQVSPGYETQPLHFSRPIEPACLYCHCQEVRPAGHTLNRYQEPPFGSQLAIGCERCHGPGELHVASRKNDVPPEDVDLTIVNPRHLKPALREAVCEQCHLQGEITVPRRGRARTEYRPGLPLHDYVSVFVRPLEAADSKRIVSHTEQMHQSACFNKSDGRFGCISCHDPHRLPSPEAKVTFYQQRCRTCHAPAGRQVAEGAGVQPPDCSLSLAERTAQDARDNCVACHMPRHSSSNAIHLAVTDHRLLRRPSRPVERTGAAPVVSGLRPDDIPLVAFHRPVLGPKDEELSRDLGLATLTLAELELVTGTAPVSDRLVRRALPLLDSAVARDPGDVPALHARGFALYLLGRFDEALRMYEAVLARVPDRELTLSGAAYVAEAQGRLDLAETYCRRLTQTAPYSPSYQERLAKIYTKREAWPQAIEAAQAAVKFAPFRANLRSLLVTLYLEAGRLDRACAEFDLLGRLDPASQAKVRPRFEYRLKRAK